ncbi:MAG: GyrI-like domain-containing protein [Defluviitaleaceae bacterium]|nr:GyrI-like domain-containing protein [Defluviitaleaceae bacterium]
MDIRVVKVDTMNMAGYLLKVDMVDVMNDNPIPKFWGEIMSSDRYGQLQKLKGRCKAEYGVCIMHEGNKSMDYVVAVALEDDTDVPEGLYKCQIPAGEYAVAETTMAGIGQTWAGLDKWTSDNGYHTDRNTSFEFYDERMANPDPDKKTFDIYVPIAKK